jgi:hypothetical protein
MTPMLEANGGDFPRDPQPPNDWLGAETRQTTHTNRAASRIN